MTMRVAIGRRECTRKEDRCVLYAPQKYECRNTSPSAPGHRSRCASLQISSCAGILISPNAVYRDLAFTSLVLLAYSGLGRRAWYEISVRGDLKAI
jgi:hypothetical protein